MTNVTSLPPPVRPPPAPEPVTKRIVVVTPAQDKLFWFVLGVFCGANWLAAMVAAIRWMATPP